MTSPSQLGFDDLLTSADEQNRTRQGERETGHLPSTITEALPFYRGLIEGHHAAMLAADETEAMRLKEEAHMLAKRLNGGQPGILAGEDAPGCVLEREAAAPVGVIPLWGQRGDFCVTLASMRARIEMDGLFGLCSFTVWPGMQVHAVDYDRPFLSGTGFRRFLGITAELVPNLTPDAFATGVIASYVASHLKNRLVPIGGEHRRPCRPAGAVSAGRRCGGLMPLPATTPCGEPVRLEE
jgi:hypothetical protein